MNWHLLPISDGKVPDASFEKTWSYAGCRLRSLLSEGKGNRLAQSRRAWPDRYT